MGLNGVRLHLKFATRRQRHAGTARIKWSLTPFNSRHGMEPLATRPGDRHRGGGADRPGQRAVHAPHARPRTPHGLRLGPRRGGRRRLVRRHRRLRAHGRGRLPDRPAAMDAARRRHLLTWPRRQDLPRGAERSGGTGDRREPGAQSRHHLPAHHHQPAHHPLLRRHLRRHRAGPARRRLPRRQRPGARRVPGLGAVVAGVEHRHRPGAPQARAPRPGVDQPRLRRLDLGLRPGRLGEPGGGG